MDKKKHRHTKKKKQLTKKKKKKTLRTLTSSVTVGSRLRTWQRLLMNSRAGLVSSRAAPGLFGNASGPLPLYFLMAGTVSRTWFSHKNVVVSPIYIQYLVHSYRQ